MKLFERFSAARIEKSFTPAQIRSRAITAENPGERAFNNHKAN
jgi:hypothetical protein